MIYYLKRVLQTATLKNPIFIQFFLPQSKLCFLFPHLSTVKVTTVSIEAQVTASVTTVFRSQATSPKGHGYWCHME